MTVAEKLERAKTDVDEVYSAGKKARESEWWDVFQNYGKRTGYHGAFTTFPEELFYPKYDIALYGVENNTFRTFPVSSGSRPETDALDLATRLNRCGVKLDTSASTTLQQMFYFAAVTHVPSLDLSNVSGSLYELFYFCIYLHTIDKIKLSDSGTQSFSSTFGECRKLRNIVIEGKIGRSVSFQWCPLTLESAVSVINALVDYYGTVNANVYTVTFSDTTKVYLDDAGTVFPGDTTWREYIAAIGWNT